MLYLFIYLSLSFIPLSFVLMSYNEWYVWQFYKLYWYHLWLYYNIREELKISLANYRWLYLVTLVFNFSLIKDNITDYMYKSFRSNRGNPLFSLHDQVDISVHDQSTFAWPGRYFCAWHLHDQADIYVHDRLTFGNCSYCMNCHFYCRHFVISDLE